MNSTMCRLRSLRSRATCGGGRRFDETHVRLKLGCGMWILVPSPRAHG